ncbi:MAG: toll/interleukin-1 receptor domain-containing protein [bacterium]
MRFELFKLIKISIKRLLPRHLLVFLKWDELLAWKRQRKPDRSLAEEAPYAYGSAQVRISRARPRDVVWVVTAPRFAEYRLPPSLVARLQVRRVVDRKKLTAAEIKELIPGSFKEKWRYVVLSDREHSYYYPLNNAYKILKEVSFAGSSPKLDPENCNHCQRLLATKKQVYSGLPAHLQTVRHLIPGSETSLEKFAREVANGFIVFLSYRRKEASQVAKDLVEKLNEKGAYCWLDNLMIPQNVKVDDQLLTAVLADGLRQSTLFVALVTSQYHSNKWTAIEWQRGRKELNNPHRTRPLQQVEIQMGGKPKGEPQNIIPAARFDAEKLASRLLDWLPE